MFYNLKLQRRVDQILVGPTAIAICSILLRDEPYATNRDLGLLKLLAKLGAA